ncbi:hypothetical protein K469DRAFT_618525 [Zopfia rhizophila CBS 207.26]|uniref:Uncharacterized protein n=1 Tax=Zopfia rhizophila CBS 207.26 TaxID=1314779 RepID=A0A6A6ER25_9PEZI|nr:hypothetical protein K469DRAFT_618525 [Zopfia rhizophila CBS 207.26]
MLPNITSMTFPGFTLISGFIAKQPETFITKERDTWKWKENSYIVTRPTPTGKPGEPFIQILSENRKEMSFKTMDGQVVMRIAKENPMLRSPIYHGMSPAGDEIWTLALKSGLMSTQYNITMQDASLSKHSIKIQNEVLGAQKGILLDGIPVATMGQRGSWSHTHREDVVTVASGMDIVLALAVNWIKIDKENDDAAAAVST